MLCTIVGAGSGLATSIARRFGRAGMRIALLSRSPKPDLVTSLEADGIQVRAFEGDASDPGKIELAFKEIEKWAGLTDTLIYNAAVMIPDAASSLTSARALRDMETNLGGAIDCVQAVLPGMRAVGAGTILLTGGGLALEPYPEWTSLGAGKAALRAYGIALNKELAKEGIQVCVVAVCGIVEPNSPFDPALVSNAYWQLRERREFAPRELIYFPSGADPFYNDPSHKYRDVSLPIAATPDLL